MNTLRDTDKPKPRPSVWPVYLVMVLVAPVAIFGAIFAVLHVPVMDVPPWLGDRAMEAQVGYMLFAAWLLLWAGVAGMLLLVLSFFRRFRTSSWMIPRPWALSLLLCGAATILPHDFATDYRTAAFKELAYRAEPLVQAIEAYRHEKGSYPKSLEELVPHYLQEIPGTDMAAYPCFYYESPGGHTHAVNTGSYELQVPCGQLLGFDVFVYWPEGNYPEYMYGGSVEEIDGWAYVHE